MSHEILKRIELCMKLSMHWAYLPLNETPFILKEKEWQLQWQSKHLLVMALVVSQQVEKQREGGSP